MQWRLYVNTTAKFRFIFDVFYYLTIKLKALKNPIFWHFLAKIPNSRGMGHRPKIVKKGPDHTLQTNIRHRGEEPQKPNSHMTQGDNVKQTALTSQRLLKHFCGFPWVVTSTGWGGFIQVCVIYDESTRRLNRKWFWKSRESNLRPLVYKA